MNSKKTIIQADLLLLVVVIIWGTTFPVMKIALDEIKPFFFITLRFTTAFIFLSLFSSSHLKNLSSQLIKKGAILGIWLFAGYGFQIVGLQYTTASRSGFITGLSVIIVPVLSVIILREFPGLITWLGVIIAIIGLAFLTEVGSGGINYGDYLTLLCAFSLAMHIILVSKYVRTNKPITLAWIQIGVVAVLGCIFAVFRGEINAVSLSTIGVVIYTGLLATALAFFIQNYAQQYTPPTHTGLILTLEPVFGALFSYIILGELIGWNGVIGGILILTGMLISRKGELS